MKANSEHSQATSAPQCCSDHVEAAKAGHVECLRRRQEDGRFLGLHDPERESAGEARKFEIWDAAVAACKAGHAQALSWLFSEGWPNTIDAKFPWFLSDLAQPQEKGDWDELHIPGVLHKEDWFLPEVKLYFAAMRNPDTSCLEALLKAGCRSEWLCPVAALEGRKGHLTLAAARGARCDARTMYHAASKGNLRLLRTAHHHATIQAGFVSGSPLLDWCGKYTLRCCFEAAAQNGHADCLAALLTWFHDAYLWEGASTGAARGGHISCLKKLQRKGWKDWLSAAYHAAETGNVGSLSYLLGLRPLQQELDHIDDPVDDDYETYNEDDDDDDDDVMGGSSLLVAAARGGLACLKLLHARGLKMTESVLQEAISSHNPECLEYALGYSKGRLEGLLDTAVMFNSLSCIQVLYDRGCFPRSGQFWNLLNGDVSPSDFLPVMGLDCFKMLVANSGPPPADILSTAAAASKGPAFLQFMHELGAPWEPSSMVNASASVKTMRYAYENGCPWGQAVLSDFLGKVECLQYAHQNGCPYDVPARFFGLPDFQVLQYAWKHMDRGWVREKVGKEIKPHGRPRYKSVSDVNNGVNEVLFWPAARGALPSKLDWRIPLFLVKEMKMGRDELGLLAQLADVRLARAAALAQCFYVAENYARQPRRGRWADVWSAMALCPYAVREKIASYAHLALPPQ